MQALNSLTSLGGGPLPCLEMATESIRHFSLDAWAFPHDIYYMAADRHPDDRAASDGYDPRPKMREHSLQTSSNYVMPGCFRRASIPLDSLASAGMTNQIFNRRSNITGKPALRY